MKKKHFSILGFIKAGIVLITLVLIAGIALSCDNGTTTAPKSSLKALTGITIKDKEPDKIPDPISPAELASQSFTDPKYTGTVYLSDETELATATVTAAVSAKATAAFGLASGFETPESFSENTTLPTITLGQALYVKVTAEDGSINYYRFSILMLSNNSQLATLTVAGMTAELGAPGTTWQISAANTGTVALSNALKTDAVLEGTPSYKKATVEYAVVVGGSGAPGAYTALEKFTFTDGDALYVKVTAENGQKFSYYKFAVQIGRNANLDNISIGGENATNLGKSKTKWEQFSSGDKGIIQSDFQPTEGFKVIITPVDDEATVKWASIGTDDNLTAEPTWTNYDIVTGGVLFKFPGDQSDVAIFITSSNGQSKRYYRLNLITKNWAPVYKGTPKLWDPTDDTNSKPYIDPIWNDAAKFTDEGEGDMKGWLNINRFNKLSAYDAWFVTDYGQHTKVRAKVLWDDDGIWVYVDADFFDYKETQNGELKIRTASRSGPASSYTPGTAADLNNISFGMPSNAHTNDSVELFINERYQTYTSGNYGEQYRSGLPNATDGTIWLSGETPRGTTPPYNTVVQFQIDKMVNAWVKTNNANKEVGYVIIMRVRWVKGSDDPTKGYAMSEVDKVFKPDGSIIEDAKIGLEFQVNAAAEAGKRNGSLRWNSVIIAAYQNVKSFGIVQLKTSKTPTP